MDDNARARSESPAGPLAMTARFLAVDLLLNPVTVLPEAERRALPPVTVVLDRGDDARFTAAALAAHRPRVGRITVHPTVGTARTAVLLHDHLTALGRSVVGLRAQGLAQEAQAEHAVRAWMWAEAVQHVIVLRSHLRINLHYLLDLHAATGAALTLVRHAPALGRDLENLLSSLDNRVVDTLDAARDAFKEPGARTLGGQTLPRTQGRVLIPGWDVPVAGLPPAVVLDRIRRHAAHPVQAGALVAAWITGASAHRLRGAQLKDLTPGGDELALPTSVTCGPGRIGRSATTEAFRVPARLRPHLLAAAQHRRLEGAAADARLFTTLRADRPSAVAAACGIGIGF
ncbi:hypothetical protein OH807_41100 [Kitasatospora sp. NBC_01560]|uniref:hypothetical protein n=1 Tax=Kitasatospora sp. NBC_01560 TaxID=2975965 RepID=UPI003867141D